MNELAQEVFEYGNVQELKKEFKSLVQAELNVIPKSTHEQKLNDLKVDITEEFDKHSCDNEKCKYPELYETSLLIIDALIEDL